MTNPFQFDLILLPGPDGYGAEAVLDALLEGGRIHPYPGDPHRAIYRNPETGVAFVLALAPDVAAAWRARLAGSGDEEELETEDSPPEEMEELSEEDEDDEEEDGEDAGPVEAPPAAAVIPVLVPSFFFREAIEALAAAGRKAGLHLFHPEGEAEAAGGAGEASSEAAMFAAWDVARRSLAGQAASAGGRLEVGDPRRHRTESIELTLWDPAKAEAWRRHCAARAALAAELEREGIAVPVLQAAERGGKVLTLCDWKAVTAVALPRTDLVLVRRERDRRGFLRTRRVVEEGIVPGPVIWEILKPWSELRTEPAELLVFRNAENPPQDILARLEVLELEPVDSARRASLVGVVDLSP